VLSLTESRFKSLFRDAYLRCPRAPQTLPDRFLRLARRRKIRVTPLEIESLRRFSLTLPPNLHVAANERPSC
jgi:hypothetical protein